MCIEYDVLVSTLAKIVRNEGGGMYNISTDPYSLEHQQMAQREHRYVWPVALMPAKGLFRY